MTEPEQPNAGSTPEPSGDQPAGQVPTTPPSPYEVPPMPGEGAQTASPAAAYPPQVPQPPATQGYPQQPYPPQGYPQQPYPGQQPPVVYGAPQAYDQQPYGQVPPAPYGAQPSYPPYPAQPPYFAAAEPPRKKKAWPWVLGGCLLVFLLGIGGCVSCTTVAAIVGAQEYRNSGSYLDNYDDYGYDYDNSDPSAQMDTFTLDEIRGAYGEMSNSVVDGRCSAGVYTVGAGKDIQPGTYFLEGSQAEEMNFYVFKEAGNGSYRLDDGVVYFGNYFTELGSGDVIAFVANDTARFYPVSKSEFAPTAPYQSGLYRAGTDMPAGTYTITAQNDAAAVAENDSAAFVMKDLAFNDDSITDTKYVIRGSSQTVTVKDGDYLELYAATATPSSQAA
ncbi:MAG: hypothetical protein RSD93_03130 [Gordonibacter sp.]|uniref:hypothetical protein n=1 Tax=Gordonibacter sp. TaxID=1968902 RepID=UPI002FCADFBA